MIQDVSTDAPVKILVADDHVIIREGLKMLLNTSPDLRVAGEAEDAHELLKKIAENGWDVILLDVSMPGPNALDVLKEIKSRFPNLPVLIYSMYPEERYAVRFIKAGASGYLNKACSIPELMEAIRKAAQGGKYISPGLGEKLAYYLETESDQPLHNTLSDREYQVLCLLASGRSISEIARELSLSPTTISTYRARILEKFRMKNNAELTQYAMQHHLID